jgi:hypothetical protein
MFYWIIKLLNLNLNLNLNHWACEVFVSHLWLITERLARVRKPSRDGWTDTLTKLTGCTAPYLSTQPLNPTPQPSTHHPQPFLPGDESSYPPECLSTSPDGHPSHIKHGRASSPLTACFVTTNSAFVTQYWRSRARHALVLFGCCVFVLFVPCCRHSQYLHASTRLLAFFGWLLSLISISLRTGPKRSSETCIGCDVWCNCFHVGWLLYYWFLVDLIVCALVQKDHRRLAKVAMCGVIVFTLVGYSMTDFYLTW